MSRAVTRERRRRRWWLATLALCVVAGLQAAALPPVLLAGSPGECVMACSTQGRECCCRKSGETIETHVSEAAAFGRLARFEPRCRELCATFAGKAPGDELWLLADLRRESRRPVGADRLVPVLAAFGRLEHDDPSTLPRPPPGPVAPV